jgi:hypothetical protein
LLLAACLAVWKQRSLDASLGIMLGVSIVAMPISWPHYLVLAAVPAAQVVRWLACHRLPSRETNVAILVTMLLDIPWVVVGTMLAQKSVASSGSNTLSFALAQIPMLATVSVVALVLLLIWLGPPDTCVAVKDEDLRVSLNVAGCDPRTRKLERCRRAVSQRESD